MEELQIPVASSAFHCIPVRRIKRIASITRRLGTPRLWVPSGCGRGGGSMGSILSQSQSGIRQPSSRSTNPISDLPSSISES